MNQAFRSALFGTGIPAELHTDLTEDERVLLRAGGVTSTVAIGLYLVSYAGTFPEESQMPVAVIFAVSWLATLGIAASSFFVESPRIVRASIVLLVVAAAVQVNGVLFYSGGPGELRYFVQVMGNVYFIAAIGLFSPWPGSVVLALAAVPLGLQVLASTSWPLYPQAPIFGLAFMAVVGAVISATMSFRYRIEEFQHRERRRALLDNEKDFVAMLSHDLANPLGAIIAMARMLDGNTLSERSSREGAKLLHKAAERSLRLAADLGTGGAATAQSARQTPLDEALHEMIRASRMQARERNVELLVAVEKNLVSPAEPEELRRILGNLLGNALRLTPEHGIVNVDAYRTTDGGVEIRVSDSGPGFPEEGDGVDEASAGMAGLGLSIVRSLAEARGGTVEATNRSGGGACVRVRFPAA